MDKIIETLGNIGIDSVGCTEENVSLDYLSLFFVCLRGVVPVSRQFSSSSYESTAEWETCQIFKKNGRLLVRV
jgi:hypothetical protein